MTAKTREGVPIVVGNTYMFAELAGGVVREVTEIIDKDCVLIDDHWKSTRWACNALYEVKR